MTSISAQRSWADLCGGLVSLICAIHCVAVSLAPALVATTGVPFLHDERVEHGIVCCALSLGGLAAARGFIRHRRPLVVGLFVVALMLLACGVAVEAAGIQAFGSGLSVFGGLAMVGAHVHNARCSGCRPT
jgi:hypothetical protein